MSGYVVSMHGACRPTGFREGAAAGFEWGLLQGAAKTLAAFDGQAAGTRNLHSQVRGQRCHRNGSTIFGARRCISHTGQLADPGVDRRSMSSMVPHGNLARWSFCPVLNLDFY